jgi:hypothetical protein
MISARKLGLGLLLVGARVHGGWGEHQLRHQPLYTTTTEECIATAEQSCSIVRISYFNVSSLDLNRLLFRHVVEVVSS